MLNVGPLKLLTKICSSDAPSAAVDGLALSSLYPSLLSRLEDLAGRDDVKSGPFVETRKMAQACLANLKTAPEAAAAGEVSPRHVALSSDRPCHVCHKDDPNGMQLCSRCRQTRYCSVTCQRSDWPAHKKTCKTKPS
eukprot:TRINITY_DN17846_c0_g1_i1.p1 TRINITY_DN17846_c0_g1~~TRINITY_DN17846_c0_g1_i1.p1  ORF type:complete len:156 (-),score=20.33 TRINITY_DN17846_c0_g1_i1:60-470(-)